MNFDPFDALTLLYCERCKQNYWAASRTCWPEYERGSVNLGFQTCYRYSMPYYAPRICGRCIYELGRAKR